MRFHDKSVLTGQENKSIKIAGLNIREIRYDIIEDFIQSGN